MPLKIAAAALIASGALLAPGFLGAAAPIYDSSALNIGLNCQWQQRCIRHHSKAKDRALKYVAKYNPPAWRIQMCNRNAGRGRQRVDWVGFDHCVRNETLRQPPPPPPPPPPKRTKTRPIRR